MQLLFPQMVSTVTSLYQFIQQSSLNLISDILTTEAYIFSLLGSVSVLFTVASHENEMLEIPSNSVGIRS